MTTNEIVVKMLLDRWNAAFKTCDTVLNAITDENMLREIVPGKNRGIYLLGHLIAAHDDMVKLLDLGEKQYPELLESFIKSPDKATDQIPSVSELRSYWTKQFAFIYEKVNSVSTDAWFEKHTSISAEDFAKEPHRNKLNVLLTRTTHLTYHTGQLVFLK